MNDYLIRLYLWLLRFALRGLQNRRYHVHIRIAALVDYDLLRPGDIKGVTLVNNPHDAPEVAQSRRRNLNMGVDAWYTTLSLWDLDQRLPRSRDFRQE